MHWRGKTHEPVNQTVDQNSNLTSLPYYLQNQNQNQNPCTKTSASHPQWPLDNEIKRPKILSFESLLKDLFNGGVGVIGAEVGEDSVALADGFWQGTSQSCQSWWLDDGDFEGLSDVEEGGGEFGLVVIRLGVGDEKQQAKKISLKGAMYHP